VAKEDCFVRRLILGGAALAIVIGSLLPLALTGCGGHTSAESAQTTESTKLSIEASGASEGAGKGMAAIRQAAGANKYLFMFFSKTDDDQTQAMRKVFDKAMEKVADRAEWIAVDVNDSSEKAIVSKFQLDRAPMPLVLAMAPNGAITGGFPQKVEEQQIVDAFATPVTEKVMKHLQDGKLVFVCVQNGKTKSNDAAMQGVRDFKADSRFGGATEIVMLDPTDSAEASFLADLKIESNTEEAMTVFLAPPGSAIAEYKGATNKEELVATLQKANTGCGPGGCGPGGCGPK
jgi:ribosomal protein L25 (general stress protein Ctc)